MLLLLSSCYIFVYTSSVHAARYISQKTEKVNIQVLEEDRVWQQWRENFESGTGKNEARIENSLV